MQNFISLAAPPLVLIFTLLFSHSAQAWTKILDCRGSNAVIDREIPRASNSESSQSEKYQIVFRDSAMIGQLLESGAVDIKRLTSLSEIVLMLRQNPSNPGGWIGEADSFSASGIVYLVHPEGDSVIFEAYRTTQSSPDSYIVLDKVGAWQLKDCLIPTSIPLN